MTKEFCPPLHSPPFLTLDLGLEYQFETWVILHTKIIIWLNLWSCSGFRDYEFKGIPYSAAWFPLILSFGDRATGELWVHHCTRACIPISEIQKQKTDSNNSKIVKNVLEGGLICFLIMEYYEKIRVQVIFKHENQVEEKNKHPVSCASFLSGGTKD